MKILVKVRPNKKQAAVVKQSDGSFIIDVDAPAIEGKANQRLIEILAEYFHTAHSQIAIRLGARARQKIVEIK